MKRKSIIAMLIGAMGLGMVSTSCEDMLAPDSERHSYVVAQDTLYSYWGIMKSLQNVAERYVILGECRADLVAGTEYTRDSIAAILNFDRDNTQDGSCRFLQASDYYHVINSCNAYLASCDKERKTGTREPYMLKEAAQVEAIRAWVYLQLVQVYGKVPFYTEPLLTTDKISDFMDKFEAEKKAGFVTAETWVDYSNLADRLAPTLQWYLTEVEQRYGFPQYNVYNGYHKIHSNKCMIPLNLILGDLYLTQGTDQSCAKAAEYYYDYLSGNQKEDSKVKAGGALPSGYGFKGKKREGFSETSYDRTGFNTPWTEFGEQDSKKEAITAIPSTTSKLWGNVLRGVNELFGYQSEILVQTHGGADTTTVAAVYLSPRYDYKQLYASKGYFQQAMAQQFETYISADGATITAEQLPVIDPNVGDARQYWAVEKERQTYSNGVSSYEKFVCKQNPNGVFTSTYPVIYRKSMVWLRFAEAINRAGYPTYAFAILKDGVCNNSSYYPVPKSEDYADVYYFHYRYDDVDEEGNPVVKTIPADIDDKTITSYDDLKAAVCLAFNDEAYELTKEKVDSLFDPDKCSNYPNDLTDKVLYYIDAREATDKPRYLNFMFPAFEGNYAQQEIWYSPSLANGGSTATPKYPGPGSGKGTIGIHSRGCGVVYAGTRLSCYNYVDKVIEKAALYGKTLTKDDLYNSEDASVKLLIKECVEDLILDEAAMELSFEGNRFFDLMRAALRRSNPEAFMADHVAHRNGTLDPTLYSKLLTRDNWFFPLGK